MNDLLQNFHFLRPWLLVFLLLPLLLFFKKLKTGGNASSWVDVCDKNLLNFLLVSNSGQKHFSVKKLIYTGLTVAAIAAAGPAWKKTEIPSLTVENPNMFVLSLAQDMQLTDITPSRLDRAKFMVSDLAEHIPQGQFGLEVYSEEPYVITPIADDVKLLKNLLPQIKPDIVPDNGDRLDRAIDLAIERFKAAGYAQGNIILFTSDVGQRFDLALQHVKKASALNYKVHVIDTSFSGNEKLKVLADTGNGVYLSVRSANTQKLVNEIAKINEERIKRSQNMRSDFEDYGYYLLFIPLFCTLMFFRRGMIVLVLLLFPLQAYAGFFLNNDQEGFRLFQKGQYEQALKFFKNADWIGATLYKQGRPEDALKEFQKSNSSLSFYNQGVILTKMCKYNEAKEAFAKALEADAKNSDAEYNLTIINELFEKAKQDPSVLECGNNQKQQNPSTNDAQEQKPRQDQSSNNNPPPQSNKEKQEQQEQSSQNQTGQNGQSQSQSQQNDKNIPEASPKTEQGNSTASGADEENRNAKTNPEGQQQKTGPDSERSDETSSQKNSENKQQPAEATLEGEDEAQSRNTPGNDNNGTERQQEEQSVNLIRAQQGNENEQYDGEAIMMQRQYREIPEDPGGLLREFIKKEYVKDRYRDENI